MSVQSSCMRVAGSLGCGLLFSFFLVWGMFLEFSLCAVRCVGTCWRLCSFVVLRPRLCLVSFVVQSWQEGGNMYVLRESYPYLFAVSFLFTCFF